MAESLSHNGEQKFTAPQDEHLTSAEVHEELTEPDSEALRRDPSYVTVNLRRHSGYFAKPGDKRRGALHPEGIDDAKSAAAEWVNELPAGTEVEIVQSPSVTPSVDLRDAGTDQERTVHPMRAAITASLYEQAVYGNQQVARGENNEIIRDGRGQPMPARREYKDELGDFLNATEDPGPFFDALGADEKYQGRLAKDFWSDYVKDQLSPEVARAIEAVGGVDSLQLAQNLVGVVGDKIPALTEKASESDRKQVMLAVTHGESMEAFSHYLAEYLKENGVAQESDDFVEAANSAIAYNGQVDLHVKDGAMTVVLEHRVGEETQEVSARVDVQEFASYLDARRAQKNARGTIAGS
jgi:hypothetical protein